MKKLTVMVQQFSKQNCVARLHFVSWKMFQKLCRKIVLKILMCSGLDICMSIVDISAVISAKWSVHQIPLGSNQHCPPGTWHRRVSSTAHRCYLFTGFHMIRSLSLLIFINSCRYFDFIRMIPTGKSGIKEAGAKSENLAVDHGKMTCMIRVV